MSGYHPIRLCAGCRDGAEDNHAFRPVTLEYMLERLAEAEAARDEAVKWRKAAEDALEGAEWELDGVKVEIERLKVGMQTGHEEGCPTIETKEAKV